MGGHQGAAADQRGDTRGGHGGAVRRIAHSCRDGVPSGTIVQRELAARNRRVPDVAASLPSLLCEESSGATATVVSWDATRGQTKVRTSRWDCSSATPASDIPEGLVREPHRDRLLAKLGRCGESILSPEAANK